MGETELRQVAHSALYRATQRAGQLARGTGGPAPRTARIPRPSPAQPVALPPTAGGQPELAYAERPVAVLRTLLAQLHLRPVTLVVRGRVVAGRLLASDPPTVMQVGGQVTTLGLAAVQAVFF